jgi:4-aminobutyrate aminotransferase-like enzyme
VKTKTQITLDLLRAYESPNVLFAEPDGSWPIVWDRARGCRVWDVEGREYLDLTAAFGVAAAGHANARVVAAGKRQMSRLLHAMGDVHPHELKAQLARELSRLTFERWTATATPQHTGKVIFCNSGFEAVEAALKTAMLATGRKGVLAFHGAYHGLGYGALNATDRTLFSGPFESQLGRFGQFLPFPHSEGDLAPLRTLVQSRAESDPIGAILVEPIQGRGGIRVPPAGFLPALRQLCDQLGMLLIVDEIYTGFGRTGNWFACEHSATIPDVICVGKALTGGFPLSACVGRADVIDKAWPPSNGEAIHTSTYLGHPVGCAMALAEIAEIERLDLIRQSAVLGTFLQTELADVIPSNNDLIKEIRGRGLMIGMELRLPDGTPATTRCLQSVNQMLQRGFILLPEGEHSNIISFTPPLVIHKSDLRRAVATLADVLRTSSDSHP